MILSIYLPYINKHILYYQSTMSLLAQQLNKLKQNNALSIAPGAPRPSFILDKQTARNTTVDVIYTMALLGYSQIKKSLFHSGRGLADELLSQQFKEINRNKLTKQQNKALSIKITRFLLIISPVFLHRGCQAVIQYLLRNYNIHVFEPEQTALIFLQYWQQQLYKKLILNIEVKNANLDFIKGFTQGKQINFTYIVKSLTYSRSLIESLIVFARKFIKQQNAQTQQVQVQLVSKATVLQKQKQQKTIPFNDFKQFVLQLLCTILQRKISGFNKQICQFCIFLSKQQNQQVYCMAMILSLSVLTNQQVHSEWINKVILNLLSKSLEISQNIFNFIIIIWQRWSALITKSIISCLLQKQHFILHLTKFQNSLYMPFYMLLEFFLQTGQQQSDQQSVSISDKGTALQVLKAICLKVKDQQFVKIHENYYFSQLFNLIHESFQKLQKKVRSSLVKFLHQYLLYEYGVFIQQNVGKVPLTGVFGKGQINKNGVILWQSIKKAQLQRQSIQIQQQNKNQQELQSEQQQLQVVSQKKKVNTILQIANKLLKKNKKPQLTHIDITDSQTKDVLGNLISLYYSQNSQQTQISTEQKNKIFDHNDLFNQFYNIDAFYYDLQRRDYNTAIKFMMKDGNVQMCYRVLEKLSADVQAGADLLYRQLCRQAVQKLSHLSKDHYKAVINIVGKLYHQYCKNSQVQLTKPLNQMMIRISKSILDTTGTQKGKFYKLIACHARFLATLTMSQAYGDNYAAQTYKKLIQIFGAQNGYCFIIGASELLATKMRNKKHFGNFIDKILIPSLRFNYRNQQIQTQVSQYLNVLRLFRTVQKCLIFCTYALQQQNKTNRQENQNQQPQQNNNQNNKSFLNSGVAKKMIINFFGLTTSKSRRTIVRKIFMFLSSLLKSHNISSLFKQTLSNINRKQQLKLCTVASKIYQILIDVYHKTKGPLNQTTNVLKQNLLKLFPLELKIDLLGPLLPLNEVYQQLNTDLLSNNGKKFANLSYFINIIPFDASDQWCNFSKQCIKRGYIPNQQTSIQILQLYQDTTPETNTNIIKFICAMCQHAKQQCLSLLPKMMEIVLKQCKQPNSYTLAIFYAVTKNLKQFIDPYLSQIFGIAIQINDEHVKKFIDGIVQAFTAPVLIMLTKTHAKSVQHAENFSYFLNKISQKLDFQSIWKTCQNFFGRSLNNLVQNQVSYQNLHNQQSQIFVNQVMKMNDNQLRKIIIDYIRWSSEKTNFDNFNGLVINSRKNLLIVIYKKLSFKIGELFNTYYGFIFQDVVKDLKTLKILQDTKPLYNNEKRQRPMNKYSLDCCALYIKQLLSCLRNLLQQDTNNQFMDSIKFDSLAPQIANIFNFIRLNQHYLPLVSEYLKPCLISLFKNTIDDYKLKTINTEILRMLRTKDQKIVQSIYSFYNDVVEHVDYRFLLFTDQMVPLLIQASSSRNSTVKKLVQSIIYKIQNLSGQKITQIKPDRQR